MSLMAHDPRGLKLLCDKEKYNNGQILTDLKENEYDFKKSANIRRA
jgi:hypothetical protein